MRLPHVPHLAWPHPADPAHHSSLRPAPLGRADILALVLACTMAAAVAAVLLTPG